MIETGAAGLSDLCVVTAVDIESKIAVRLLADRSLSEESGMKVCRGSFGDRRVTVLQSGMGAAGFAERLAKHLAENHYDALIVVGLAGGLDPKLRAGDAVIYDLCYDARAEEGRPVHDEVAYIAGEGELSRSIFEALKASGLSCIRGAGVTVSRIITEGKDKLSLGARYGAAAVDMETYDVLTVCAGLGLPATATRVVSDEASRDLPDFNRGYDVNGRPNGWRMTGVMIARPLATLRFLISFRRVLGSLRENLRAALGA